MSAPNIARVPAGNGVHSGRFAPTSRADSGLTLVDDTSAPTDGPAEITHRHPMVAAIAGLAEDHVARADGDLYPEFRAVTASLTDEDADRHWTRLVAATRNYERFADLRTGAAAAEDALQREATDLVGDRAMSDYESVSAADRPGENDYIGFDFDRAATDLAADWDTKMDEAAVDTVRAMNSAQSAAAPAA